MIKVHIRTNLDNPKHGWPNYLPHLPRVGDYIIHPDKSPKGYDVKLQVIAVTWTPYRTPNDIVEYHPVIELNLSSGWDNTTYDKTHGW